MGWHLGQVEAEPQSSGHTACHQSTMQPRSGMTPQVSKQNLRIKLFFDLKQFHATRKRYSWGKALAFYTGGSGFEPCHQMFLFY